VAIVIWFATRPAAPPPRPLPALVSAPASLSAPAVRAQAGRAAEEEPSGEVERPASAVPVATAPGNAPAAGFAFGPEEPFPAHFRESTALFWFDDDETRDAFLARLGAVGPSRALRLTGHATEGEVAGGRGSLGLSRAWAVRKWLVRQGFGEERISTVKGRALPDRGPHDDRGLQLNNWVDISVE
jgi:outer membrane protein OmpA-like peptidoglycan-associated protein